MAEQVLKVDALFVPALEECSNSVKQVFDSQAALEKELHNMSTLLEKFVVEQPDAPSLASKVEMLNDAKERMSKVNLTLEKVQTRLERLFREHGAGKGGGGEDNRTKGEAGKEELGKEKEEVGNEEDAKEEGEHKNKSNNNDNKNNNNNT